MPPALLHLHTHSPSHTSTESPRPLAIILVFATFVAFFFLSGDAKLPPPRASASLAAELERRGYSSELRFCSAGLFLLVWAAAAAAGELPIGFADVVAAAAAAPTDGMSVGAAAAAAGAASAAARVVGDASAAPCAVLRCPPVSHPETAPHTDDDLGTDAAGGASAAAPSPAAGSSSGGSHRDSNVRLLYQ